MIATQLTSLTQAACTPIGSEVYRGLTARPKTLAPWLFYDSIGSRLFEAITELPEYYLTRTERGILAKHAEEIVAVAADGCRLTVLELGAGTATKTGLLLRAAVQLQGSVRYRAIDVSESALAEAKTRLESELRGVTVEPKVADYTDDFKIDPSGEVESHNGRERRLVLHIGSSIGNFSPTDALALLHRVRAQLLPGDGLLLGVDMVKDRGLLEAAYNDDAGVTAEFNKNILVRINRELEANFNPKLFCHQAIWNARRSRMEIYLESLAAQRVSIAALGLEVHFVLGETIHTENSYKFTNDGIKELLVQGGFAPRKRWSDSQGWFGVYLASAC